MNIDYKALNKSLSSAYEKFQVEPVFKIGILNDRLLAYLVNEIREKPTLDNFILFTTCLNFFYSTRLQAAVNKQYELLKTQNDVIMTAAGILKDNWENGLNLLEVSPTSDISCESVEKLRRLLKHTIKRGQYSFSTKVFHQLNNNYPILDRNVNLFMQVEGFRNKTNYYSDKVSYCTFYETYKSMMENIGWDENKVNSFDNSIWVHVDTNRERYFKPKTKMGSEEN